MNWIAVDDRYQLPRDGSVFLAIWKGTIYLCQFDVDEDCFYVVCEPARYSQCWGISRRRPMKFTHWMPLPNYPE